MGQNLATSYYIKALDHYPYDLTEAMESLNYALSADDEFADAHSLMGRLYKDQFYKYEEAQYHFEMALSIDLYHTITYYPLIDLLIRQEKFKNANKLIDFAYTINGIHKPVLGSLRADILERTGDFKAAKNCLKNTILQSICSSEISILESDLERVKKKLKHAKKMRKKRVIIK